jgi:DNA invertase Pin-like site-specific DNA recombinase
VTSWKTISQPRAGRLMIAVLGGLADVERDLIRTGEGRARAKLRGQHMRRPPKMTVAQKQEARSRRKEGESFADLARSYGVSPAAIYRPTADGPRLRAVHFSRARPHEVSE